MPHFDIAIIGSGSGNSLVTDDLADRSFAIIDDGIFGGTCLNVGCIPTKMYVYAADQAWDVRHASRYGVDATLDGIRWPDIRDRIFGRIDPISAGGRDYRAHGGANTALFESRARFVGPHELALADGQQITADQIVIAAGARPVIPPALEAVPYLTSSTILRVDALPRRLVILGAGFIAAEFAHVASALGSEVTLIARRAPLLRALDVDISSRYTALAQARWDVRLGHEIARASGDESGVRLELTDGSIVEADAVLVATGRRPNSDWLDLDQAGVKTHADARIMVDCFGRTDVPGVWALGDISSPYQLKHVANHEARVVAHNLAHPDDLREVDHRFVPSAVFTHPQIASVGLTEEAARARGLPVVTALQAFGDTAYGWAMEDQHGMCKLVADRVTGRLLGAHLMGAQASTLIQPLIQAMTFDQHVHDVAHGQYWIHPALSEVVENALLKLAVDTP